LLRGGGQLLLARLKLRILLPLGGIQLLLRRLGLLGLYTAQALRTLH
jgi:hypothetical protein